jgi:hypothetical protein
VFIGGLAFSGKTPLRIALSAHPRLALTRRTAMWQRYHGRYGDLGRPENLDRCLSAMLVDPNIAQLMPDRLRIEREFRTGPSTYARLFALVHGHHAERLGKQRWGDQMGMIERHAGLVLTEYPTAQMIHMIRDPRTRHAAAASVHDKQLGRLGWETARWRDSADLARRNVHQFRGRYLVVRYEALCSDLQATLYEVMAFLAEEFDPVMTSALADVTFDDPRHATFAPSRQRVVSGFIERHAAVQMAAHGYPMLAGARDARPRTPRAFVDRVCDEAGVAVWRTLHAPRVKERR